MYDGLFVLALVLSATQSHAAPSVDPSPNVTFPPRGDPCKDTYDQTLKSGHCVSPNKCVDKSYVGKWSVYAVPCDDGQKNWFYGMDPNWGGAHITMTSFQAMSSDQAHDTFGKLKDALQPGHPDNWQPQSFSAESKKDGTRRIDIKSNNLDIMPSIMKKAGWESPTEKGNWHVTMSDLTGKSFDKEGHDYKARTYEFSNDHWALVLVECKRDDDGNIAFHRQDGFHLVVWETKESTPLVV